MYQWINEKEGKQQLGASKVWGPLILDITVSDQFVKYVELSIRGSLNKHVVEFFFFS